MHEAPPFPIMRPLHVRAVPDSEPEPQHHRDIVARVLPGRS